MWWQGNINLRFVEKGEGRWPNTQDFCSMLTSSLQRTTFAYLWRWVWNLISDFYWHNPWSESDAAQWFTVYCQAYSKLWALLPLYQEVINANVPMGAMVKNTPSMWGIKHASLDMCVFLPLNCQWGKTCKCLVWSSSPVTLCCIG